MKKKKIFILSLVTLLLFTGCKTSKRLEKYVKVIDFSGYSQQEVIDWSFENGVEREIKYVYESDSSAYGTVIGQSLMEGHEIKDVFTVKISNRGLTQAGETVEIPNIIGMTLSDAEEELLKADISVAEYKYESSDKPKDTVILCDPLPGVSISSATKIKLVLSSGEKREKTIKIPFEVSTEKYGKEDIKIDVYIEGVLNKSLTKIVTPDDRVINFAFKGTNGSKRVDFKVNDLLVRSFDIDFDELNYHEI